MKEYSHKTDEWIGHVTRHKGLLKQIKGSVKNKNYRGRPKRPECIQRIMKHRGCMNRM